MEGFLHYAGKVICVLYKIAVLYKRFCGTCDIYLLEYIAAYLVCGDLTCDTYQRYTVGIGRGDRSEKIRGTRARSGYTYRRGIGHPRIAVCSVACIRLMSYKHMVYV